MSAPTGDNSMRAKPSLALATVFLGAVAALTAPADAACKKFGFTVNDYGKEGPTNDAKNLLDKHISEWAAQNGVTEFQTGKKSVSCELFLDVVLFDEYTCTATANVCWGPSLKKTGAEQASSDEDTASGGPPAPVSKADALGIAPQAQQVAAESAPAEATTEETTAEVDQETPPAVDAAEAGDTPDAHPAVHTTTAETQAPPAAAGAGALVETGALADKRTERLPAAEDTAAAPTPNSAERAAAAAAAASAAAAAERAAAAAETAANAAKEAAAAAVAASSASKANASVPPLGQMTAPGATQNQ